MEKIVLAKVGNIEVTKEDMVAIMRNLPQQQAQEMAGIEGRKHLLDEMVAGELFYLEAEEKDYEKEAGFIKMLEETKHTLLQRYAVQKVLEAVKVEESDIKAFYEENKSNFVSGPKATAKHILMEKEEEIIKVKAEIDGGLAFEEAAKKYSTCPSKERGGDLGSFEKGRMVPEFEAVTFVQEIGTVSEPVKTQFGYHLIVVTERTDSSEKEFEEVSGEIKQQLEQEGQKEAYMSAVEALKVTYKVEMFEDGLK